MLGHDSEEEVKYIEKYIHEASRNSGIDARIILAVVMQESHGNLRTSAGGGITPGIMQALGSPHCETTAKGKCDENTIKGMINAGVFGTDKTPGLKACYEKNGRSYGAMLRCYNSGSIPDPSDLTKAGPGTPSYVSDVANRLKGMEPAKCWF
ncbi:hypothetical protein EMCG_05613 [[Emmonsia] crescens]|uniref:Transglycosylase SLT domain-containing protein n=1 Tax=[Emmonsia] crescens TaxID=73230 RepID=A0A0G2IEI6_9EURO|nr:hypothetical protein EMCG_05613 [Emmonsia crescens UAMH 3008]